MSTIGGDVVRALMIDDDGNRGVFDFGLSSAKSGGVVNDAWIHIAVSVTRTSVVVYVDGRKLDAVSDRMHDAEHMRDLQGPMMMLGEGRGEDLTLDLSINMCGDYCRSEGYSYFGLQWTNQCICDNDFGSFGEASDTSPDGYGACDVDYDGVPDCGYGQAGYSDEWYADPSHNSEVGATDERGEVRQACGWRNAVYEITETSASYQGCYLDGQTLTRCATAVSCEMCALMGAPSALNPEGCGWSGRNGGGCFDGYTTNPWECSVSEYGFPADRRGGQSDQSWWAWAQTDENVFWPDPTAMNTEACTASTTDPVLQMMCSDVDLGTDSSEADCRAVASQYVGVSQQLSWADAREYCQANFPGGDLASVHSDQGQINLVAACADAIPEDTDLGANRRWRSRNWHAVLDRPHGCDHGGCICVERRHAY